MKVHQLIEVLKTYDPDHDVIISGIEQGFGVDFELNKVHQWDETAYVRLIPDKEYEEDEE